MGTNGLIEQIDSLIVTIDNICKKSYKKEGAKQATKLIDEYALADGGLKVLFEKTYLEKTITSDVHLKDFELVNIGDLEGGNGIQSLSLAKALLLIGAKRIHITIFSSLMSLKNNDGNDIKKEILNFDGKNILTINIENQNSLLDSFNSYDIVIFDEFKSKSSSPINIDKFLEIDNRLLIDQTIALLNNISIETFHLDYNTIISKSISPILLETKISKNSYIKQLMDNLYAVISFSDDIDINSFSSLSEDLLIQKIIEDVLSVFQEEGKTNVSESIFKREFKKALINRLNSVCSDETLLTFHECIYNQLVLLSNNITPSFDDIQKYIINSILLIHKENVLKATKDSAVKKIYEFIKEIDSVNGYLHENEFKNINMKIIKELFNEPENNSQRIIKLLDLIKYKFYLINFFKNNIIVNEDSKTKFIIQVGKKVFEDFAQIGVSSLEIINENPIQTIINEHEEFIKIVDLNFKQKIIIDLLDDQLKSDLEVITLATDALVSNKDIKIALISKNGIGKKTYYLYYEKEKPTIKLDTVKLKSSILQVIQNKSNEVSIKNVQDWYASCYEHLGKEQ